jgi:hypoxanthine phosphoribosyltransferase
VERETMTWDDLGAGSRSLAETLLAGDWIPDLILGISRGGLLVAGARDFCAGRVGGARVAVLYEKSRSTVACEYVWRRTDRWITFPWSVLPPVTGGEAT